MTHALIWLGLSAPVSGTLAGHLLLAVLDRYERIHMNPLETHLVALLTAVVGLAIGLGAFGAGVGQDVISVGGLVLASAFEIISEWRHSTTVKLAIAQLGKKS